MPELMQTISTAHQYLQVRLELESFDSGEECSVEHWMAVCKLVDEGDDLIELTDTELIADMEPAAWN
jgi:hypothetical protein